MKTARRRRWILIFVFPALVSLVSCKREERELRPPPVQSGLNQTFQTTSLHAGGWQPQNTVPIKEDNNAYDMSEGKELYTSFNCANCHAQGGGDIGPPLKDAKWIYGSEPQQIYASIVEGRPNGMPSFRNRIPDHQLWRIVAYVRSMGGLASSNAAPGRSDHMKEKEPPNSVEQKTPVDSSQSKSSEMPQ